MKLSIATTLIKKDIMYEKSTKYIIPIHIELK